MLKVVLVLGCLLCLTLAYSDDSASSREERTLWSPHPPKGHGPPHGHPCLPEDILQKLLEILRNSTTTTTTTTAAPTTMAAATT